MPMCAGVEEGRNPAGAIPTYRRVGGAIVWEERLEVRVELETANACSVDQPAGSLNGVGPGWIDMLAKGSGRRSIRAASGHLLVGNRGPAGLDSQSTVKTTPPSRSSR